MSDASTAPFVSVAAVMNAKLMIQRVNCEGLLRPAPVKLPCREHTPSSQLIVLLARRPWVVPGAAVLTAAATPAPALPTVISAVYGMLHPGDPIQVSAQAWSSGLRRANLVLGAAQALRVHACLPSKTVLKRPGP